MATKHFTTPPERSSEKFNDYIECHDSLIESLCLASGAMTAILGNDQFQHIGSESLSNVLQIVQEKISEAKQSARFCYKHMEAVCRPLGGRVNHDN